MLLTKGSTLFPAFVAAMMFAHLSAPSLGAQGATAVRIAEVSRGSRVRVETADPIRLTGTLVSANADSLVVQPRDGLPLALPLARVTHLEVSRGVQSHGAQGAAIGLAAGVALGAVVAASSHPKKVDCGSSVGAVILCTPANNAAGPASTAAAVVGLGAMGALLGALIGHAGHETWIPVPVARASDVRAHPAVQQVARQTGIGVALQF